MRTILICLVCVAMLMAPASSLGTTKYFCDGFSSDSNWSSADNWELLSGEEECGEGTSTTVPTAADKVIIVSGLTCDVDISDAVADTIEVESTAVLNIKGRGANEGPPSRSLTLFGSVANTSTIDGTLNLEVGLVAPKLIFIQNNHTLSGDGKIVGQDNNAEIRIDGDERVLTSQITIEGKLKFPSLGDNAKFINQGVVNANTDGTIEFLLERVRDTAEGAGEPARWQISHINAVLKMNVDLTSCGGECAAGFFFADFEITAGTLEAAVIVATSGQLLMIGGPGKVDASAASATFSN